MSRNDKKRDNAAIEKLADIIAGYLVRWQLFVAAGLNTHFNRYSKNNQKRLLLIFCLVSTGTLLLCLNGRLGQKYIAKAGTNTYQPVHIGQPSAIQRPPYPEPTDTITSKKPSIWKSR